MQTQPDLYDPMCAATRAAQPDLYPSALPDGTGRHCHDCNAELVTTESGFLCCPRGHGKLIPPVCDLAEVAARHRAHDRWLGRKWRCPCGACRLIRGAKH